MLVWWGLFVFAVPFLNRAAYAPDPTSPPLGRRATSGTRGFGSRFSGTSRRVTVTLSLMDPTVNEREARGVRESPGSGGLAAMASRHAS